MYINKLIKKQVMLILATIVLVGTLAVTTSFAVFEETKSNATDQKMTIGDLDVTYTGGSAISITDINPMTDSTAFSQTNNTYTFSIKNIGTVPYNFKIKIINNPSYTTNLLPHQYIRYALYGGNTSSEDIGYTLGSGQGDYEIQSGVIEANDTLTYKLKLWVADASTYKLPNSALGQEIHLKISVEGKAGSGWLPSNLKDRILALNEVETPITTPGVAASTSDEALLARTEDDYGTSYYFRGAVKNNYVQFANKCWRIVRITGDGSVKIVLHNDNTSNVANPCVAANNSNAAAFAHYNGAAYTSAFNSDYDDNAYVGFMYGATSASDYDSTHANINKSTILTNLETWYANNLTSLEDKLADIVWCNDKTNVTDTTFDPLDIGNVTGLGYGENVTYYGATQRLVSASGDAGGTGPSLKCNGELSKITTKIGLLTADELAFAGYAYYTNNKTTYLQENATGDYWWSLSPSHYNGNGVGAFVWYVVGDYGNLDSGDADLEVEARPSISLKPSTNVTGDGTSSSPFIVS